VRTIGEINPDHTPQLTHIDPRARNCPVWRAVFRTSHNPMAALRDAFDINANQSNDAKVELARTQHLAQKLLALEYEGQASIGPTRIVTLQSDHDAARDLGKQAHNKRAAMGSTYAKRVCLTA